jgi:hypothetical protein
MTELLSRKIWLMLYLAVWSTAAAQLSFELVYIFLPKRGDFEQFGIVVPFVAFPASLGVAFLLLRKESVNVSGALAKYAWRIPPLLYFLILLTISAGAASVSPAVSLLVFGFGFVFGLPALVIGIPIHLIGLMPLVFFEDRFFSRVTADSR